MASSTSSGIGQCDVCALADGDRRPKMIRYCKRCKAWICGDCWHRPMKRAKAMLLHGLKGD